MMSCGERIRKENNKIKTGHSLLVLIFCVCSIYWQESAIFHFTLMSVTFNEVTPLYCSSSSSIVVVVVVVVLYKKKP